MMRRFLKLSNKAALLLSLSTTTFAITLERINLSNTKKGYNLEDEQKIFIQTFTEAYKDIPLSSLRIEALGPYLKSIFKQNIIDLKSNNPEVIFYRAVDSDSDKVVGFVSFELNLKKHTAYIRHLAVDPKCQGKGLGKLLVFSVVQEFKVRHLSLVTRKTNHSGVGFYKHIGFTESDFIHEGLDPEVYVGFEWHRESK